MHRYSRLFSIVLLCSLFLNGLLMPATPAVFAQTAPDTELETINMAATSTTPIGDVVKISSGYEHTCSIISGGAVQCWGRNQYGQLGDGTTENKLSPVNVANLFNATDIAAGQFHTCAVTSNGSVKCWGSHLGLTSTNSTLIPVDAPGLSSGVKSVVAGSRFTCVLTTSGGVKCWGVNNYGQLGDGGTTSQYAPVDISGLTSGVLAISAGYNHVCALMQERTAKCWGYGNFGVLGNGSSANSSTPVDVLDISDLVSLSAGGQHTCAANSTGAVKCWGDGRSGQLGNGVLASRNIPQDVSGLINGTKEVAAGGIHTCAVMTTGNVKCWGYNGSGQIGDDTVTTQNTPVDIPINGINHLALGNQHSCALTNSGAVRCWGNNSYGQVGNGTSGQSLVPVPGIPSAGAIQMMDIYANHGCAVNASGGAICWGENTYGQIGDGTTSRIRIAPVAVVGLTSGVKMMAAGGQHSCALTTGGAVKCWGRNNQGQLGDGTVTDSPLPLDVIGLSSGVKAITGGNDYTCALMESGGAKCWGYNGYGQLGDGTSTFRAEPFDVVGLGSGVAKISAGSRHTCAVMSSGSAKCWGNNVYGQLGNGTTDSSLTPIDVSDLGEVVDIDTGFYHTCALTSTNGAKCWGYGIEGRLGSGGSANSSVPVAVVGSSSDVAFLTVGQGHACTVTLSGGIKCWGYGRNGQLGNDTVNSAFSPVRVTSLNSGISKVFAGGNHTCALLEAGSVQCWGLNNLAQFGNSGGATIPLPVDVIGQDYGVQGQVLDASGQPQAGVRVQVIGGQTVNTDNGGAYLFDALSPGIITIWPQKDGYIFSPSSRTVRIPQDTASVNFTATAVVTDQPPEVQSKPPLLVVHGIQILSPSGFDCNEKVVPYRGAYHTTLADLPEWFKDTHQVWIARYDTSALHTPSIAENANCLREQVDDVYRAANRNGGDQKITIIAHSMGGLVMRACLAYSDCRRKVETVYTLGSPHAGLNTVLVSKILLQLAENALLAQGIPVPLNEGICMWQPALCEMSAEEMLVFNLDPGHNNQTGIDYVFIGGEATPRSLSSVWSGVSSIATTGFTLVTDGYNDGIVGRDSAVGWATISGFFPTETGEWTASSPPLRYWTDEVHFANLNGGFAYHQNRDGYGRSHSYDCIAYHMGIGQGSQPSVCKTATTALARAAGAGPQMTEATESVDGVLNLGETITHTLQMDTSGASTFALAWSSGAVRFELPFLLVDSDSAQKAAELQYMI
ncbi:MAG: carboxypeptidase regulatory-like domain-containing protein [Caldilineaceae bacterium]